VLALVMFLQHARAQHRVSVRDTKPDSTMATVMVTANSRNTRPTMPPISSTGMNTQSTQNVSI